MAKGLLSSACNQCISPGKITNSQSPNYSFPDTLLFTHSFVQQPHVKPSCSKTHQQLQRQGRLNGALAPIVLVWRGAHMHSKPLFHKGTLSKACCWVQDATNVGDEGGFAPSINSTTEGLDLIVAAIAVRLPVCGAQLT